MSSSREEIQVRRTDHIGIQCLCSLKNDSAGYSQSNAQRRRGAEGQWSTQLAFDRSLRVVLVPTSMPEVERLASRRAKLLAVRPCKITLSTTVHNTVAINVVFPGNLASKTMIANTMLARPRGPNHPTNNDSVTVVRAPTRQSTTGNILITVRLGTA
jgi:hypothetical protein